jgi:glutathione S-transferase
MRLFIDWFNRVWKVAPNAIEGELRRTSPDEGRLRSLDAEMSAHLELFDQMLAGREHLMGEFSAADCVAFPFLKYSFGREEEDDELFHRVLERHQRLDDGAHARLAAWIRRVDRRPRA